MNLMIRVTDKLDMDLLALIRRHYLNDPITFAYVFYDIMYYPEFTEVYLNVVGNDIIGFTLIYRGFRNYTATHVFGNIEEGVDYIPWDSQLILHINTEPRIVERIIRIASRKGQVEIRGSLTMVCDKSSFKAFNLGGDYVIRRLAINDLDQFIEIKSLQGVKISKAEAIARLLSPHWHYYGAFLNNELVSMAGTYLKLPEIWVVGDVFTLPQHRNRGLAKAVTSAVTNDSLLSGAMTMLHVFEDNSPAIKAYKRLGYRVIQTLLWINYKS